MVYKKLNNNEFVSWDFKKFPSLQKKISQKNIQVWKNGNRVVVVKNYSSEPYFGTWEEDQIPISYLYDILESKSKNNLYFLLILDWEVNLDSELIQKINRAEKDDLVCRKYVLHCEEDFERVPFLQEEETTEGLLFNYEQKFKENLQLKEEIHSTMQTLIDAYFLKDYFSDEKAQRQIIIKKLITGEV